MTALSQMPSVAPVWRRLAVILGWLSLFATLALLSPGVVATANADEAPEQTAGPSCPASAEADEANVVELSQMIEGLRSDVAEGGADGDGVVSLNTRGYNYPTGTRRAGDSDR